MWISVTYGRGWEAGANELVGRQVTRRKGAPTEQEGMTLDDDENWHWLGHGQDNDGKDQNGLHSWLEMGWDILYPLLGESSVYAEHLGDVLSWLTKSCWQPVFWSRNKDPGGELADRQK